MQEPTVKGRVVTRRDGTKVQLAYTPTAGSVVMVEGKAVVVQAAEDAELRTIKCPHCKAIIREGADLCCPALATELNQMASKHGGDLNALTKAFEQWYQAHAVVTGAA